MRMLAKGFMALTVLGLATTGNAPSAQAQNLFDVLFGGGLKKSRRVEATLPARKPAASQKRGQGANAERRRKAPDADVIKSPEYFTYKPDLLVRVDFAPVIEAQRPVSQTAREAAFESSVAGLTGFELRAEPAIAKALTGYYSMTRDFIWVTDGAPNGRASEALRVLGEAATQGLSPTDYGVAVPNGSGAGRASSDDLVRFEMQLSARVLRYIVDVGAGRIDPNRISGYYDFPGKTIDLQSALRVLAHTGDAARYLASRQPQNEEYAALQAELVALESQPEDDVVLASDLLLKPGQTSAELPKIISAMSRKLPGGAGSDHGDVLEQLRGSEIYAAELVPVVKAVQAQAGIKADGVIGPRTVATLAGVPKAERRRKLVLAMEALRWLPSSLGSRRVFINQPAYQASYIEGDRALLTMRVVVGARSTQTSFFYDEIEQVDYNPYWGVPQSILVNEMLPRLRRDPGYLDRAGYEVTDGKGRRVPSASVDWWRYGDKVPYNVRQTPSEANALGELKILFPNKHAIYMHDTPSKSLFARDVRALSHGCVRLQDPRGMAAAVLGATPEHVAQKLQQGHSSERLTQRIPVYVAYFTAWPGDDGRIAYFDDVYGRDDRLTAAIDATDGVRSAGS